MISKIEIKNIASFDASGVVIDGLKKINFIYGSNGCGKTTISKCLSDPDLYIIKILGRKILEIEKFLAFLH